MHWVIGLITLGVVGVVLRKILDLVWPKSVPSSRLARLHDDLQAIYHPFAQEIGAHTAILGITLNDAFNERDADRLVMAWRVVRLAMGEWERIADLLLGLLEALAKTVPAAHAVVPVRRVAVDHFKSRLIIDNVRLYEFLDQLLFSSKRRFALQLHLLFRATTTLNKEFKHACREGELSLETSDAVWTRLDHCFHDFDLIAKETLLALHTLLLCLSAREVEQFAAQLKALLDSGVRVSVSQVYQ